MSLKLLIINSKINIKQVVYIENFFYFINILLQDIETLNYRSEFQKLNHIKDQVPQILNKLNLKFYNKNSKEPNY